MTSECSQTDTVGNMDLRGITAAVPALQSLVIELYTAHTVLKVLLSSMGTAALST